MMSEIRGDESDQYEQQQQLEGYAAFSCNLPSRCNLLPPSPHDGAFAAAPCLYRTKRYDRHGDVILILDGDKQEAEDLIPTWIKVYYEDNCLKLPGKILQQWSYLWADNNTAAPYVAFIDDDIIFDLKVTPGLLFNLTDGKPYVIGSERR
ncbi:unnamed protein product [Closterium sp. NIES-54]